MEFKNKSSLIIPKIKNRLRILYQRRPLKFYYFAYLFLIDNGIDGEETHLINEAIKLYR
jgi:hypothetical protein